MAIAEISSLSPQDITRVYDLIVSMKGHNIEEGDDEKRETKRDSYKKVRDLLKNCEGNLSDDIHQGRAERI